MVSVCDAKVTKEIRLGLTGGNNIPPFETTTIITRRMSTKACYRSMGTTGDPVPVGQRDVPVNHFTD